jgi:hypothetical protein
MASIVRALFVVATTPLATISLLLLLSNPPFRTLKHAYPLKLANDENSSISQGFINLFINPI